MKRKLLLPIIALAVLALAVVVCGREVGQSAGGSISESSSGDAEVVGVVTEPIMFSTETPTAISTTEPIQEFATNPTEVPVATPAVESTVIPVEESVTVPTSISTVAPMAVPTPTPTPEPTQAPATKPTTEPAEQSTPEPTSEPTAEPTQAPATKPTTAPTTKPAEQSTPEPTAVPTAEPTPEPTAEPHVHSYVAKSEPSTCETSGRTYEECSCGDVINETKLAVLEHDPEKNWSFGHSAPTCKHGADYYIKCKRCGVLLEEGTDPKLDHTPDSGTIVVQGDCKSERIIEFKCTQCGIKCGEDKYIVQDAHNYAEFTYETWSEEDLAVITVTVMRCSRCGTTLE